MKELLKDVARTLVDRVAVPIAVYCRRRMPPTQLLRELEARTARDCADYVTANMAAALQFEAPADLRRHALSRAPESGLVLEFGVYKGKSINALARQVPGRRVHGFDSFRGLSEDWRGADLPKGYFDLKGSLPKVPSNVTLVPGWFNETLPNFIAGNPGHVAFAHIDSDTFEAARLVLEFVGPRLVPGSVVVFDEYLGYRGWRLGEFKAWQDFVAARRVRYEYLAFSAQSVAVRIRTP